MVGNVAPTKPRSQKRRKPVVVSFRATAEELALIDAAAKARGMTTSAWLRSVTVPLAKPICDENDQMSPEYSCGLSSCRICEAMGLSAVAGATTTALAPEDEHEVTLKGWCIQCGTYDWEHQE